MSTNAKLSVCLSVFLMIFSNVNAQSDIGTQANKKNFERALKAPQPTVDEIDSILMLSVSYSSVNVDSSLQLAQRALSLTENNQNGKLYVESLNQVGDAYRLKGEDEKSHDLFSKALAIAEQNEFTQLVAESQNLLGSWANSRGDYETSIKHFLSSAKLWEELEKKRAAATIYSNISGIFFNLNELQKSDDYIKKVASIGAELNDNDLKIDAAGLQALSWMTQGIHYYLAHEGDSTHMQQSMDTLNHYFEKSEQKYIEGIALARKIKDKKMMATLLNNFVALSNNMGKYQDAKSYALEAEQLAQEVGAIDLLIQSKFNLCSVNRYLGNLKTAETYGEESLQLAKDYKIERKEFLAMRTLYELYKKSGKFNKANTILEGLRAYDNRVGTIERTKAVASIEAQYQTVKKEKQILELEATNSKVKSQRNTILGGGLLLGLLGFFGVRMNNIRKDRNDKKAFAEALIFAQEEERKRIARDLHDGVGQSLLLIKKQMETTHETTLENQEMISATLEEVRSISRDLHPFQLEKFGLTSTVEDMIIKVNKSTDLFITKEIENIDGFLPAKSEIHLFRTIQEALSNVIKHADATAARVEISKTDDNISIVIQDNGKGFDPELTIVKSKSLGLRTMHERITSIGGKIKIKRGAKSGSIIEIIISRPN